MTEAPTVSNATAPAEAAPAPAGHPATQRPTGPRSTGQPIGRVDALVKVTGQARYAGEYPLDGLAHGWIAQSSIARGRVIAVDSEPVLAMPGVLAVIDHTNAPTLGDAGDPELLLLQGDQVHYRGQVVALVVAETLEQARAGARALHISYAADDHDVQFRTDHPAMYTPDKVNPNFPSESVVGDVEAALASAAFTVDQTYTTPAEHNNPMEPHATTAQWDGDTLLVYDSNQGAGSVQSSLVKLFGLPRGSVRVRAEHVGGGFGAKGSARPTVVLAPLAARQLNRPVRVTLSRQQMFALVGYRTPTAQQVRLGSDADGRLQALDHLAFSQTSTVLEFAEQTAVLSRTMYATDNLRTRHRLLALDVPTPRWMRAPGEAPGSFALESAMDELAQACSVDPVQLRVINEPTVEPDSGRPFSSRNLLACLGRGSELFGWHDRDPRPAVRRDGRWLIGTGMATSTYPARNAPSTCQLLALPDGSFEVRITAADIGTGARTALTQVAADALGTDLARINLRIADSDFGQAMIAGGSMGTASWSWAIVKGARELTETLATRSDPIPAEGILVRANTAADVYAQADVVRHAFGAQFVEVAVDDRTGEVRVPRMVGVFAAGHIVNTRLARSQIVGGMTMGLSMALFEESVMDLEFGDYLNHDLAGYHIATNADVGSIEVDFIDEHDTQTNPAGIKGIGEIGIVGTAAAIANAVWHATGRRQRDLPLRPDRIIGAQ
ncbi:xanthine dehydrogenase family protein molybdopterin-binding subunit [soil metagenome]